jgi:hypothetical protein
MNTYPVIRDLPLGTSRQQVEAHLGKPVASRRLPDGGRVDTYDFQYTRRTRQTATLTFGPDGRLMDYEAPPKYSTPDESLDGPARRDMRDRCRVEHPRDHRAVMSGASAERLPFPDYPYHECVVGRLAIWGIE